MKPSHVHAVKRIVSNYSPAIFGAIRYSRQAWHHRRNARLQASLEPWKAAFIRKFGFVVQSGPFAGLKFHESSATEAYLPLLIGSYEAETHGFIESALARAPKVIADVGCDAGYVAVGLALRAPDAKIVAFDIRDEARTNCSKLAALNHVTDRVTIEGECTLDRLDALCAERALVFCDCEGFEFELLDPIKVPNLRNADIIVELHDFMRTDVAITPTVLARFENTHDISVTGIVPRAARDYPCVSVLPKEAQSLALHEDRVSYQQFAYLKAKSLI